MTGPNSLPNSDSIPERFTVAEESVAKAFDNYLVAICPGGSDINNALDAASDLAQLGILQYSEKDYPFPTHSIGIVPMLADKMGKRASQLADSRVVVPIATRSEEVRDNRARIASECLELAVRALAVSGVPINQKLVADTARGLRVPFKTIQNAARPDIVFIRSLLDAEFAHRFVLKAQDQYREFEYRIRMAEAHRDLAGGLFADFRIGLLRGKQAKIIKKPK